MSGKTVATTYNGQVVRRSERAKRSAQRTFMLVAVLAAWSGITLCSGRSWANDVAQTPPVTPVPLAPDPTPLDLNVLKPGSAPPFVITDQTISQTGLTLPSLWWVKEQFAAQEQFGGKLLEKWLAYPQRSSQPGRVDFVVNRQLWSLLDYLERYAFVHEFGTAAKDYGYNIRVFDQQATFLAAYTCDFSSIDLARLQIEQLGQQPAVEPFSTVVASANVAASDVAAAPAIPTNPTNSIECGISLDSTGKSGFSGRSRLFGAGSAK